MNNANSTCKAVQREARFSDFEQVSALKQRVGMPPDSTENWLRLWRDNPALVAANRRTPMGWILESDGVVVAYLGSIPLMYYYAGRSLIAAATCGFAAEPQFRAQAVTLAAAFMRQAGVDLLLNTTASESAAKIFQALGAQAVPQPDSDIALLWILNRGAVAQFAARRKAIPGLAGRIAEFLITAGLRTDFALRRQRPPTPSNLQFSVLELSQINEEFTELWKHQVHSCARLLAFRDALSLRWHLQIPHSRRQIRVLSCRRDDRLVGYVCVSTEAIVGSDLLRSRIVDLFAVNDESSVIEGLFAAAYEHSRKSDSHILEILGFPDGVRRICRKWNPYRRRLPSWGYWYCVLNETLKAPLSAESSWYLTPYDGDSSLWPSF